MKTNALILGIVLLLVGMSFLAGALLQVQPTAKSERVYDRWLEPPGQSGTGLLFTSSGQTLPFTPTKHAEPTGISLYLRVDKGGTSTPYTYSFKVECGYPSERRTIVGPFLFSVGWGSAWDGSNPLLYAHIGVYVPFQGDQPDYAANEPCHFYFSQTIGPGKTYWALGSLGPVWIVWGEPVAAPDDSGEDELAGGPFTETATDPDAPENTAPPKEPPCDTGLVRDAVSNLCVKPPPSMLDYLLWGLLALLIVAAVVAILLGIFG